MSIFKIKNQQGLFSTGGIFPEWSKRGKVWKTLGNLKSHLTLIANERNYKIYNGCNIVEFEMIEKSITPVDKIIEEQISLKRKENEKMQTNILNQKEKEERELLVKLKAKYE